MRIYPFVKRSMDVALSGVALTAVLPLLVLLSVIICLDSPGGPFFVQQRVGKDCKPFRMVKLRSMVKTHNGMFWTGDADPRITRVGRVLRALSLDEIPQLWNVLVGDMSLVGPRPNVPVQESQYPPAIWKGRHRVKPGITGLAQVNWQRAGDHLQDQMRYDLAYASDVTLKTDAGILLKTVSVVIYRAGAD